jgi:hypothetical protein
VSDGGTVVAVNSGVLTIKRANGSRVEFRPHFLPGSDTEVRVGDRVAFERGRLWKTSTRGALETK